MGSATLVKAGIAAALGRPGARRSLAASCRARSKKATCSPISSCHSARSSDASSGLLRIRGLMRLCTRSRSFLICARLSECKSCGSAENLLGSSSPRAMALAIQSSPSLLPKCVVVFRAKISSVFVLNKFLPLGLHTLMPHPARSWLLTLVVAPMMEHQTCGARAAATRVHVRHRWTCACDERRLGGRRGRSTPDSFGRSVQLLRASEVAGCAYP